MSNRMKILSWVKNLWGKPLKKFFFNKNEGQHFTTTLKGKCSQEFQDFLVVWNKVTTRTVLWDAVLYTYYWFSSFKTHCSQIFYITTTLTQQTFNCLQSTIETSFWCLYYQFEDISHLLVVFLMLTWSILGWTCFRKNYDIFFGIFRSFQKKYISKHSRRTSSAVVVEN